jgi:hypothetical protein
MYLIANVSGKNIKLKDIAIELKVKEAIDLDKLKLNKSPEDSLDLLNAIKTGKVKILKKKTTTNLYKEEIEDNSLCKEDIINSVKDTVRDEIKKQLEDNNKEKEDIISLIKNLTEKLGQTNIKVDTEEKTNNNYNSINDKTLSKIHSRAISRITQNVDGSINIEQEQKEDSNLSLNISELEDLI